jgi:hypothetical protein
MGGGLSPNKTRFAMWADLDLASVVKCSYGFSHSGEGRRTRNILSESLLLLFMGEMTRDFAKARAVHVGKHLRDFFGAIER